MVSIPACHAGDRGSIPRRGELFLDISQDCRGIYFAERGSFWEGHFWGAPGQNFRFLEGKFENIKISRNTLNIFCYLHLKSGNLHQKS